jgi:hypothetical protein
MTTRTAPAWLSFALAACSGEPDPAQLERISTLEEALRSLNQEVTTLRNSAQLKTTGSVELPFRMQCQAPLTPYIAMSDAQVTCRARKPSPEGVYPQCSVIFQKEVSVETKDYFEFAVDGTPQLYAINNYKDGQLEINGTPAFQATFEAQRTPLPMKMVGALFPYKDGIYTLTCFASSATFGDYEEPFRRTISSFEFKVKNQ